MTVTMKADGVAGKVAIWTGAGDAPFTNPLGNVGSLLFHSDLLCPAIIATYTGSITLPAVGVGTIFTANNALFAHGRAGTPYVEGYISSGLGSNVALAGSVIVQQGSGLAASFARHVHLGADATNVYLHDYATTYYQQGFGALTLSWTVYVLDTLL